MEDTLEDAILIFFLDLLMSDVISMAHLYAFIYNGRVDKILVVTYGFCGLYWRS